MIRTGCFEQFRWLRAMGVAAWDDLGRGTLLLVRTVGGWAEGAAPVW